MLWPWMPDCHAMSARQSKQPCQAYSSTEEKSHSVSSFVKLSSNFSQSIATISSENECGSDNTIRETALAAVYLTMVSSPLAILSYGSITLSNKDVSRKSMISSTLSGTSISDPWRDEAGISMIAMRCIILTRNFLAKALDWILSDSVRRRIFIDCWMMDCPTTRSECARMLEIVDKSPVF